jgi:hypothetical protein
MRVINIEIKSAEYWPALIRKAQEITGLFLLGCFGFLVVTFSLVG